MSLSESGNIPVPRTRLLRIRDSLLLHMLTRVPCTIVLPAVHDFALYTLHIWYLVSKIYHEMELATFLENELV